MAFRHRGKHGKQATDEEQNLPFFTRQPRSSPDVEATLDRIKNHNGVFGVIVVNTEGIAIRSSLDNPTTQLYLWHCQHLIDLARHAIRDIDPTDDLKFFRVRSKKNELVIAPDKGFTVIALQSVHSTS